MPSAVENVRAICRSKKIPYSKIEVDLGYGNGYFNPKKTRNIPSDRLVAIAKYLNVSIEQIASEKEKQPDAQNDGLKEKEKQLLILFDQLTDEQQNFVLSQLKGLTHNQ